MRRQRGLVLLFVGLFLIAGAPLSPAWAQSLDCAQVVPVIPNQFPAWSDGTKPEVMTLVHISPNSDAFPLSLSVAERSRRPLSIASTLFFDFAAVAATLRTSGDLLCQCSDVRFSGWEQAPYYATIQLADIDG